MPKTPFSTDLARECYQKLSASFTGNQIRNPLCSCVAKTVILQVSPENRYSGGSCLQYVIQTRSCSVWWECFPETIADWSSPSAIILLGPEAPCSGQKCYKSSFFDENGDLGILPHRSGTFSEPRGVEFDFKFPHFWFKKMEISQILFMIPQRG